MAPSWFEDGQVGSRPSYRLAEHARIARLLRMTRADFLTDAGCWFGGGTAIVMTNGEYRLSSDVDFLCSSQDGYRALRQAVTAKGCAGVFEEAVNQLRDFRCDQYGLRTAVELDGQLIKFEIVREGRIDVSGAYDHGLGIPLLSIEDQFTEKMLANSDRGKDPSVCYRDALDLGVLILNHGNHIPDAASAKAEKAYGSDVWRDAKWVVDHLGQRSGELERAAATLRMDVELARQAISALAQTCGSVIPTRPQAVRAHGRMPVRRKNIG